MGLFVITHVFHSMDILSVYGQFLSVICNILALLFRIPFSYTVHRLEKLVMFSGVTYFCP